LPAIIRAGPAADDPGRVERGEPRQFDDLLHRGDRDREALGVERVDELLPGGIGDGVSDAAIVIYQQA